jgi:hypothetical protein
VRTTVAQYLLALQEQFNVKTNELFNTARARLESMRTRFEAHLREFIVTIVESIMNPASAAADAAENVA